MKKERKSNAFVHLMCLHSVIHFFLLLCDDLEERGKVAYPHPASSSSACIGTPEDTWENINQVRKIKQY